MWRAVAKLVEAGGFPFGKPDRDDFRLDSVWPLLWLGDDMKSRLHRPA
jgi:hypothetical protein